MEIADSFRVSTPIDDTWKVLLDIEGIAPCMPGAQLQEVDGDEYRGVVKVKVGRSPRSTRAPPRSPRSTKAHRIVHRRAGPRHARAGQRQGVDRGDDGEDGDGTGRGRHRSLDHRQGRAVRPRGARRRVVEVAPPVRREPRARRALSAGGGEPRTPAGHERRRAPGRPAPPRAVARRTAVHDRRPPQGRVGGGRADRPPRHGRRVGGEAPDADRDRGARAVRALAVSGARTRGASARPDPRPRASNPCSIRWVRCSASTRALAVRLRRSAPAGAMTARLRRDPHPAGRRAARSPAALDDELPLLVAETGRRRSAVERVLFQDERPHRDVGGAGERAAAGRGRGPACRSRSTARTR